MAETLFVYTLSISATSDGIPKVSFTTISGVGRLLTNFVRLGLKIQLRDFVFCFVTSKLGAILRRLSRARR